MPLDAYNRFSDAQDISGSAAAGEQSTNILDLDQAAGLDWKGTARTPDPSAGGHNPIIEVKVVTAFVGAADAGTLTISLYEHTAATSIESGNIIAETDPITVNIAGQAIGTILWRVAIPFDEITERYIGLYYYHAAQNLTTGAVDASIMWGTEKQYP